MKPRSWHFKRIHHEFSTVCAVSAFGTTLPGSASGATDRSPWRPVAVPLHRRSGARSRQVGGRSAHRLPKGKVCRPVPFPPGGSVTAFWCLASACCWTRRTCFSPSPRSSRKRSDGSAPLTASAVRHAYSGGNLRGVFSDTAAGSAAVSSGCFFRYVSGVSLCPVASEPGSC